MASVKKINGRTVLVFEDRLGGINQAILGDEAVNKDQMDSAISNAIGSTIEASNNTFTGTNAFTNTTESTSSSTGSIKTSGGLGVVKNLQVGGTLVTSKGNVENHTGVPINTTGAGTLSVVTSGVIAGLITSTSAAAVTVTLDSVANIITAFAAAGVTITTGSQIKFIIDDSQGANTVTLAVDAGTTIAVATPAITGGATLTVSTANKIGLFSLYLTSATTAILSRVI